MLSLISGFLENTSYKEKAKSAVRLFAILWVSPTNLKMINKREAPSRF